MSPFSGTVGVLWQRELLRFVRQRSRLMGALVQPLLIWMLIGGGLSSTFRLTQTSGQALTYLEFFFPGVVVMMVLFAAIFGTITVVEDRHSGFLQGLLVGPASPLATVLGKTLGVSTVGLLQAALFLLFAPLAGLPWGGIDWLLLAYFLVVGAVGLAAVGFALAWYTDSSQGYHVWMSILLLPAWVLSGAVFPTRTDSVILQWLATANPMTYLVSGARRAFYDGRLPQGTEAPGGLWLEMAVVAGLAVVGLSLASWLCARRR